MLGPPVFIVIGVLNDGGYTEKRKLSHVPSMPRDLVSPYPAVTELSNSMKSSVRLACVLEK